MTNNAVVLSTYCFLPVMEGLFFIISFNTLFYYISCLPTPLATYFEHLINLLYGIIFTKALRDLLNGFALGRNKSSLEQGSIKLESREFPPNLLWKQTVALFEEMG